MTTAGAGNYWTGVADGYAYGVVEGCELACAYVRQACARHFADLERAANDPEWYQWEPDQVAEFHEFAREMPHTKGEWARRGELFEPEPWQAFCSASIFGWVEATETDGRRLRRFQDFYIEVPRKNGKSLWIAICGLFCFLVDGEFGAEVYSGATTEKQAWEVFRPARQILLRSPDLVEAFGVWVGAKSLSRMADGSRFEPIVGNPGDGAAPSFAIVDEYHEHKSDAQVETMRTGMGSRSNPLLGKITTAGDNLEGPCYADRGIVEKVLGGVLTDDRLFGVIYTIDEGDDWTTEESLRKANPNANVSVSLDWLKKQVRDAINDPRRAGVVKTKHLDIWVASRSAWVNLEHWNAASRPELTLESCIEWADAAWLGLDMASKTDLSAAVFFFKRLIGGRAHYRVVSRHYLPSATVEDTSRRGFQSWAADGWLRVVGELEIEIDGIVGNLDPQSYADELLPQMIREDMTPREVAEVRARLLENGERWAETGLARDAVRAGVIELAYDAMYGTPVAQGLERVAGVTRVEMPMGAAKTFSPAMFEISDALASGRLEHNGDPVLTYCVSNVVSKPDARNNLYPRKQRASDKIDGAVAMLIAAARAMGGEAGRSSIYEEHDEEAWMGLESEEELDEVQPSPAGSIYSRHSAEEWGE